MLGAPQAQVCVQGKEGHCGGPAHLNRATPPFLLREQGRRAAPGAGAAAPCQAPAAAQREPQGVLGCSRGPAWGPLDRCLATEPWAPQQEGPAHSRHWAPQPTSPR